MKWLVLVLAVLPLTGCGGNSGAERCASGGCEDDGNDCTVSECNADTGSCETVFVVDGASCAQGSGECEAGQCVAFCSANDCDDDNPCTDDRCDLSLGRCRFTPVLQPLPCDFGAAAGMCDDGQCIDAGLCDNALERCADGNECSMDRCDPANGQCSSSTEDANGAPCGAGAGICASGSCEIAPQTKRFTSRCTDTLFDNAADVALDLTISPDGSYVDGASSTGLLASFRLDQGLGDLLQGLGVDSTEITSLEVDVAVSGAAPAALSLTSERPVPFVLDFSTTDTVDTRTVLETITPDGIASGVDFEVSAWTIRIRFENMNVPVNVTISPGNSDSLIVCEPLEPDDGSIRYPQ